MNTWLVLRRERPAISLRINLRAVAILLLLLLSTIALLILTISLGEYPIPLPEVWSALLHPEGTQESGPQTLIVRTLRLPRGLIAVLVGWALAVAGTILQGLTRNPLAAPDVIGINAGASLAAVTLIVLNSSVPVTYVPLAAFGGAFAAAALSYVLSWQGHSSGARLVIVGIGIAAIGQALVTLVLTSSQIMQVSKAITWMAGSVYGRSWEHFWPLLAWLCVLLPSALVLSRDLDMLHLGDAIASGLGTRVERQRALLLLVTVGLAGIAVATAGPVAFVGLMAPHIGRRLVGATHGVLLPVSALIGGLILLLADLVGRLLFAPVEIPCGVITAIIGAPFLLYLLYRSRGV